jgi:ribosomal-protein-alanine N-acetyltransferase
MYGDLADAIGTSPGLAWRVEGTSEYVIGGRWRRREDIGTVEELHARRHRRRLLAHLRQQLRDLGASLLVLSAGEQDRNLGTYLTEGFGVVDEIVRYQRDGTNTRLPLPDYPIRPLTLADRAQLMEVDHAAFPWLWWNSEDEFDWYLGVPGVEAYVLLENERVVAYAGLTISGRQGHLDRLAVHPNVQTRGYGKALVLFVLQRMAARRVERVALTTQVDNYKSAGLYAALGFVRTAVRYPIYGVWLKDEDPRSLA